MPKAQVDHFDAIALVRSVYEQPIGLVVNTNHPEGFRRILYLRLRQHPNLGKVSILQSPESPYEFWLVREDFQLEEAA